MALSSAQISAQISEFLTKRVQIDSEIVTYRILSRTFAIHVNTAKNELSSFHKASLSKGSPDERVYATYQLSGDVPPPAQTINKPPAPLKMKLKPEDKDQDAMDVDLDSTQTETQEQEQETESQDTLSAEPSEVVGYTKIVLCSERELEAIKSTFTRIRGCHVYCLSPSPIKDPSILSTTYDQVRQLDLKNGRENAQRCGMIIAPTQTWKEASASKPRASVKKATVTAPTTVAEGSSKPTAKPGADTKASEPSKKDTSATTSKGTKAATITTTVVKEKEKGTIEKKKSRILDWTTKKETEKEKGSTSVKQDVTRGVKRHSPASDTEPPNPPKAPAATKSSKTAGPAARVKKGVVISDEEEEEEEEERRPKPGVTAKGRGKAEDAQAKTREKKYFTSETEEEEEVDDLAGLDRGKGSRMSMKSVGSEIPDSEDDRIWAQMSDPDVSEMAGVVERTELDEEDEDEDEDAPEHVPLNAREARNMPKTKKVKVKKEPVEQAMGIDVRAKKTKRYVPVGKRRVVKTITKKDAKGYTVTEDVSEFETDSEWERQKAEKMKEKEKAKAEGVAKENKVKTKPTPTVKPKGSSASLKGKGGGTGQPSLTSFFSKK